MNLKIIIFMYIFYFFGDIFNIIMYLHDLHGDITKIKAGVKI